MKWRLITRSCLGSLLVALPIVALSSKPATAELQWRISFDEGTADITVPDRNTTTRYSGRLRKYDLHIAKMFEVTYFMCAEGSVSPGIEWSYRAGGGSIDMGNFYISCQLADMVAEAYKVRRPQPTVIYFSQGESGPPEGRDYHIGILDLERDSNKTTRWLKFVQGFKPRK